jgi:titin
MSAGAAHCTSGAQVCSESGKIYGHVEDTHDNLMLVSNGFLSPLSIPDVPSPPRDLKVTDVQRESISVVWQPSEDDGGSPITNYILEKRDAKKTTWSNAGKVKPKYFIRVIAENEIGQSEPCELKDPVKAKSPFGEFLWHSVS